MKNHVCEKINTFPLEKFHQLGVGKGRGILIVGESPAPNGWAISGKACYRSDGKILPTGKRLNELLGTLGTSVEESGFTINGAEWMASNQAAEALSFQVEKELAKEAILAI